jgi:hypothetical protein
MTLIIVGSIVGAILVCAGGIFLYIFFKKCLRRMREKRYESINFSLDKRDDDKKENFIKNSPSTEMTSTKNNYDKDYEEKPYYLQENHPDFIKTPEEPPQYNPPQENLIDKPIPSENEITPSSQNIIVDNPIPQAQQDLGPNIPPVINITAPISNEEPNPPQENIINEQVPPPNQIEYPPQELVENNPVPPQNQEEYPSQDIVVNEAVPSQNEPNIPQENNNNPIQPENQEQIPPQDNNDNNNNPQQNGDVQNSYSGGGGIYQ